MANGILKYEMCTDKILNQKYQLLERIGKGGFAVTYLASGINNVGKYVVKHLSLKKSEAVKNLELIKTEARIISQLNHPGIPKFFDFFTKENEKATDVYIVLEYIEGQDLLQLVKSGKVFREKEIIEIALKLCAILSYLHNFSPLIIHRDIKPENIIMTKNNDIYLIDFGAVKEKILYGRASELGLSTIIGTQGYMPIEQFEGRPVSGSDIYALGLTLIHLLSGKDILNIEKEGLYLDFRPTVNISESFALVIEKMIEPDWKKRFQNTEDLKKSLLFIIRQSESLTISKDKTVRTIISKELSPDENLRWSGQISKEYLINHFFILFAVIMSIFIIFSLVVYNSAPILLKNIIFYETFILVIILPAFFYISYKEKQNTFYAISDKRMLIIQKRKNSRVRSYGSSDLRALEIKTKTHIDGNQSLIFSRKKDKYYGSGRVMITEIELNGIKNPDKIEKIVRQISDNHE